MRRFFKTVALVSVFSTCEKFLGFLYRIFLSHSIGAEGIGLYQVALSVFGLVYTFCSSGVPVTVSRLITKDYAQKNTKNVGKVISSGLFLSIAISLPTCIVFYIFRNSFSFLFADSRSLTIFLSILPSLVFTCVYSVLRGVFWGKKDFLPCSIIDLLEEICMIVVGILLISFSSSVYQGAFSAGIAVLVSYIFSFTLAVVVFFVRKNRLSSPFPQLKPLVKSSTPITVMRTLGTLTFSLISIILPQKLIESGLSKSQAMTEFGATLGQAFPILSIPTTIIGSFILVLIPEISQNYYAKNNYYLKRDIEKGIKLTTVLTLIFTPVFLVCGEEIGIVLFGEYLCGKYIKISSFLMLFMGLSSISTSILNSMGLENKTLIFSIITGFLLLASIWILPQYVGIYSVIVGFTLVYVVTTILNLRLLGKYSPLKLKYKKFVFVGVLTVIPSVFFGLMVEKLLLHVLGTFFTLICCTLLIVAFNVLMFFSFSLISFKGFKQKIKKIFANKNSALS